MSFWRRLRRRFDPIFGPCLADELDAIDRKWAAEEARMLAEYNAEAARDCERFLRFADKCEAWIRSGGKTEPPQIDPKWRN
jgi:hypothetical protein